MLTVDNDRRRGAEERYRRRLARRNVKNLYRITLANRNSKERSLAQAINWYTIRDEGEFARVKLKVKVSQTLIYFTS